MGYPYSYYNSGYPVYRYPYYADPTMYNTRVGLYTAPENPTTTDDLSALKEIHEKSKPLVLQTEALANKIFPNDGQPIVEGNVIRTNYGKSKSCDFVHASFNFLV